MTLPPQDKTRLKTRAARYSRWLSVPCVALLLYWLLHPVQTPTPLPSDERMIENFKARRADFAEAVRRYRDYPRPPNKDTSMWFLEGDTLEVFKRAGIDHIADIYEDIWLPDPYSPRTGKIVLEKWAKGDREISEISHKHVALYVAPASTPRIEHPRWGDDRDYLSTLPDGGAIWKDYYFFPEAPRIENGELLGPVNHAGHYSYRKRVFSSLDRMPFRWREGECVYRPIEPQWFLRMCKVSAQVRQVNGF